MVEVTKPGPLPLSTSLPVRTCLEDVFVTPPDKVPPHDEGLVEGFSPQQDGSHRLVSSAQGETRGTGVQNPQVVGVNDPALEGDLPGVDEEAVFARRRHLESHVAASGEVDLCSEESGVGGGANEAHPGKRSEKEGDHPVTDPGSPGLVVRKVGHLVPGSIRKRHPQLHTVEGGFVACGHLGVRDATPGRHEVQVAGANCGDSTRRIPVFDLPGKHPTDGLQTDVGVGGNAHSPGRCHQVRTIVVEEAPCSDGASGFVGERSPDRHRSEPSEGDIARGDDLQGPLVGGG